MRADRAFAFGQTGIGNLACKDLPAPTGLCTVIVPPSASGDHVTAVQRRDRPLAAEAPRRAR